MRNIITWIFNGNRRTGHGKLRSEIYNNNKRTSEIYATATKVIAARAGYRSVRASLMSALRRRRRRRRFTCSTHACGAEY